MNKILNSLKNLDMRKVIGTIVGSIIFLACIAFFTYAFYNWRSENTLVNLGIQESVDVEFTMGPDVNVENIGPVLDYNDGVKATFTANNSASSAVNLFVSLDISSITDTLLVESFKYKLLKDTSGGTSYTTEVVSGDFSTFGVGRNSITTTETIAADSTYSYLFVVYIDGNMANNLNMRDSSLVSTLIVSNGEIETVLATTFVQNLYNDGSELKSVNIGGDTNNPTVSLNATQGIMLDNNGNYRYYGADPNNYVWYNDELWRIISVGNVKANGNDTTGETRVKIVKADILTAKETGTDTDITAFSWDSSVGTINGGYGVNDWSQADLMTELNTLYYNSTSGTCYIEKNLTTACDFTNTGLSNGAKNLTADALYYLGGVPDIVDIYYADDYYTFERGTSVYSCSTDDGACPRATTWTGRIGIIYPSDYLYATDLSLCTRDGGRYSTVSDCTSNDWLFYESDYQWTITPYSLDSSYVVYMRGGTLDVYNYLYLANGVKPVQYLKSEVVIVGGVGTSSNPYQLSIIDSDALVPVTFDNDGGTGTSSAYLRYGDSFYSDDAGITAMTITIPTKTGYSFVGYYTGENGSGTKYVDSTGTIVSNEYLGDDATLYAFFKDSVNPVCTLSVSSATYDSVKVSFSCSDDGGISSYNITMTENSTNSCDYNSNGKNVTTISKSCSFGSFNLSSVQLSVTDNSSNTSTFSLDSTELDAAYELIYEALNSEYEVEYANSGSGNLLDSLYPVGSIYVSASSTSPATIFGGTWEAYATGRTLIGVGSNGTDSYTESNSTGGSETVTLAAVNLPAHYHSITPTGIVSSTFTGSSVTTSTNGTQHLHELTGLSNVESSYKIPASTGGFQNRVIVTGTGMTSTTAGAHTHTYTAAGTISSTFTGASVNTNSLGTGNAFNIVNPYIVTYIWRRTA